MYRQQLNTVTIAAIFGLVATLVCAQNPNDNPAWVLYEQGKLQFSRGEYGEALRLFKIAIEEYGDFPEAEVAIGDVFWQSGEFPLAEQQYQKAYNMRALLYVPFDQYTILYKLVHLYKTSEQFKQMEDTLLVIVAGDPQYAQRTFQHTILETYENSGIDQLLRLYRFDESFATHAYGELGWFYYRTGRFSPSMLHSLFSIIPRVTESMRELRKYDPDLQFENLEQFLEHAFFRASIATYLFEAEVFKALYYLACSAFASGYPRRAQRLWRSVSNSPHSGRYGDLASRQLVAPWIEPYLSAGPQ